MLTTLWAILVAATPLPTGVAPAALPLEHFPDRFHAVVWRNWQVAPIERIAAAVDATPEQILACGQAMGLAKPSTITPDQSRRSYITVIRRNWHLLPYEQLLTLLDWTPDELAFALREDDFLYHKLGNLKPQCSPVAWTPPTDATRTREREIAAIVQATFPAGSSTTVEPLFQFVHDLSSPPVGASLIDAPASSSKVAAPRFCYSYFALYGDPLLDDSIDPYPDGYLARLRAAGVNGVWLQGVLFKLTPFPWEPSLSKDYERRLKNLNSLVDRAKKHGIGVYLYLNEPRSMPLDFFAEHPDLKGAVEGEYAALCSSRPEVQRYLREGIASVSRAVPGLAGVFTITASENLTNCWSHGNGAICPHCAERLPATVIAEVNSLLAAGLKDASQGAQFIAWDWGWNDAWAVDAVNLLPVDSALMSVSEWGLPITRGGIASEVGEYSISAIGPGPRATRHWAAAHRRGLKVFAKIQAGVTWELGSVPYLPALKNVAEHAERLRAADVDGTMLGWTLGGYPSPNLEVVAQVAQGKSAEEALAAVAANRFGDQGSAVQQAWRQFSEAIGEYPYNVNVVYSAPHHVGPANLLWSQPTGYRSTMVGFPYDDLPGWCGPYPRGVLAEQFAKVADGFDAGVATLQRAHQQATTHRDALQREQNVAETAAIHFCSVANQARFIAARDRLAEVESDVDAAAPLRECEQLLNAEIELARRLHAIQSRDSRIGYEATNHYFYVPLDLAEKVLNCRHLLDRWLPAQRARFAGADEAERTVGGVSDAD